jgi:hypothetical protein
MGHDRATRASKLRGRGLLRGTPMLVRDDLTGWGLPGNFRGGCEGTKHQPQHRREVGGGLLPDLAGWAGSRRGPRISVVPMTTAICLIGPHSDRTNIATETS